MTTEIVDHTLFDLIGTAPFYEDIWAYQKRIGEYAPADSAEQRHFMRRYYRTRRQFMRPAIQVAWPRLSSQSFSAELRNKFLAAVTQQSAADQLSAGQLAQRGLYQQLLRQMQNAPLLVEQMRNTGLYTLISPARGVYAKPGLYWPRHDWQSSNTNRTPVGQFAVSRAILDRAGTHACFVLEHQDSGGIYAEFIFAEKRNGRWTLTQRWPYWTS